MDHGTDDLVLLNGITYQKCIFQIIFYPRSPDLASGFDQSEDFFKDVRWNLFRLLMQAALSDHRPIAADGPIAAHRVRIEWPAAESWLELKIRRLTAENDTPFEPFSPRELDVAVDRDICVDPWESSEPPGQPGNAPALETQPGGDM